MKRSLLGLIASLVVLVGLVPPAAAGGGCTPDPQQGPTDSTKGKVAISECAFAATVVRIDPGQSVTWTNEDLVPHSVSGAAYSWGSEATLAKGDSATYTFDEPGVFPYYCVLHPTMVGAVVVGDGGASTNAAAAIEEVSPPEPDREEKEVALTSDDGGTGTTPWIVTATLVGAGGIVWMGRRRWNRVSV